jgi:hypothetical protein
MIPIKCCLILWSTTKTQEAAQRLQSLAARKRLTMSDSNKNPANDPFDLTNLDKLRLSQDFAAKAQVKAVLTTISARKPHKQEWVRVRPGEEHRFTTGCFVDKDGGEVYMVSPNVYEELTGNLTPTILVTAISRNSLTVPFLWPLVVPDSDRPNRWHESAIEAASIAESQWTKVVADMAGGCYVPHVAMGSLAEPDWSEIPTIGELLKLTFKSRFIGDSSHPVLRRLRGEV